MFWQICLVLLLATHLITMQLASAGPLVCVLLDWRAVAGNSKEAEGVARRLAGASLGAVVVGSLLGLLLAWLAASAGNRDYSAVIARFYDRVWWGGMELLVYVGAMIGYSWWYRRGRKSTAGRVGHRLLAVFAATNLLYHFPPLLTVMVDAIHLSDLPAARITSAEFRSLIAQTHVIAKSLHFTFAAIAICGSWLMWHDVRSEAPGDSPIGISRTWGAIVTVAALAIQLLIGLWLVVLAGPLQQAALMGKDTVAAGFLMAGVLLSLVALNQSASVAMGEGTRRQSRLAAGLVLGTVVLMVAVTARLGGLR